MRTSRPVSGVFLLPLALVPWASPANATVLLRKGLEQLTTTNPIIVQARVLDIHSYWNPRQDFILTDIRVRPSRVLKGQAPGDVEFTLMGGSVGDRTILLLGGADLAPGSEYVLFLGPADLPGAAGRLTIPDHSQGAFRIEGGRATSQATDEPLLPDASGSHEPAGGRSGVALDDLVREILEHTNP